MILYPGLLEQKMLKKIVPNIVNKIKEYNSEGNLVIFTKDTHEYNYLTIQEGRNLPIEHCIKDTWGWKVEDSCRKAWRETRNIVITGNLRNTFYKDTFGSIELAKFIKDSYDFIDEVEFCGLVTNICVISNVLIIKTFVPEVKITVDCACVAGTSKEMHDSAINVMKSCGVNIENE